MELNGEVLDFDIYEFETAKRYEEALPELQKQTKLPEDASLAEGIRAECEKVFRFFDVMFGEETRKKLFGEKVSLNLCLDYAEQVMLEVNRQRRALEARAAKYSLDRVLRRGQNQDV